MGSIKTLRKTEFELSEEVVKEIKSVLSSYEKYNRVFVDFFQKEECDDFSQIDFALRCKFRRYLNEQTAYRDSLKNALISCFDNLKLSDIKRKEYLQQDITIQNTFFRSSFFLLYYPDYRIAYGYKQVSYKEEALFWDFECVSKEIAYQIKTVIIYLTQHFSLRERTMKFRQLKCLMKFCTRNHISDIGKILGSEKRQFKLIESSQGIIGQADIIDLSVYAVEISETRFDFTRHIWYMDALKLSDMRVNEARPIKSLDFREIECSTNREYCKEYMKYLIAITDLSMASIRGIYGVVRALCSYFSSDVLQLSENEMDSYINFLESQGNADASFNSMISEIKAFYFYMQQKYEINRDIFRSFYYKKVYTIHHERKVEDRTIQKILKLLSQEDVVMALMYRISLETGLRINEICTLSANGLRTDGWLTVYQKKMKTEKMIPISGELYEMLRSYVETNHKKGEEYIFCNQRGRAYNANTFSYKMVDFCKRNNISCENWVYRSHDYRHHIATVMYQQGVELNVIRDFLGHKNEEMTKHYIDEMDSKIRDLQADFFKEKIDD